MTARRIVAIALLGAFAAPHVEGQQARSVRLGISVDRTSSARPHEQNVSVPASADTPAGRPDRTARAALIGAGIGAAAGFVAAIIATHQASVTDHSEDAVAYIALTSVGALIGLVVGGVIGFVRG